MTKNTYLAMLGIAAATCLMTSRLLAQEAAEPTAAEAKPRAMFRSIPWSEGTIDDAMMHSAAGTTIPMATFTFTATKDNSTRSATIVGTSPFASPLASSTVPVVVVPVKVALVLGSGSLAATLDPTAKGSCTVYSDLQTFQKSPLVNPLALTFNGINVGTTTFVNGFRRAEFWSLVHKSSYGVNFTYSYAPVQLIKFASTKWTLTGTKCGAYAIVDFSTMQTRINNLLSSLASSGTIGPNQFVIFLLHNTVMNDSTAGCCVLGYHSATGSPVQTYGVVDWDSTGTWTNISGASIAGHEMAEWLDDPLTFNETPAWGGVGQVPSGTCQTNLEVGDPLSGTLGHQLLMNGIVYSFQDLAFFSWFFNSYPSPPSYGAGGLFSAQGTFIGPSRPCPPGGSYPVL
jgi:hypothetical protein